MDEINAYICFDEDYLMQDMQKMNKSEKKNFENIKHKLQSLFTSQLSLRKHLVK
jgi:hypothetical protein